MCSHFSVVVLITMTKGSLRKRVSLGFQFCDEGQRHGNKQQAWWEQDTSWKQRECQLAAGKTTPLKSPQTMSPTGAKCSNAQNYEGISQSNPHTQRCGDPFACANAIAFMGSHSTCGFSSPPPPTHIVCFFRILTEFRLDSVRCQE